MDNQYTQPIYQCNNEEKLESFPLQTAVAIQNCPFASDDRDWEYAWPLLSTMQGRTPKVQENALANRCISDGVADRLR